MTVAPYGRLRTQKICGALWCHFSRVSLAARKLTMTMGMMTNRSMRFCALLLCISLLVSPACASCSVSTCIHGSCDEDVCQCEPNFAGGDCTIPFDTCDDGDRTCFNGSVCVRNSDRDPVTQKYAYHCDCTKAYGVSPFAGLQCENEATSSCVIDGAPNDIAFCVKDGVCKKKVKRGERHPGCNCADEFEGQHCQYLKGEAPPEDLASSSPGGDGKMTGVAVFFIVFVSLAFVGVFGFMLWRTKRQTSNHKEEVVDAAIVEGDLQLQETADGEII